MNFLQTLIDVLINPSPDTFQRIKLNTSMPERDSGLIILSLTGWLMLVRGITYAFYRALDSDLMAETLSKYGAKFSPEVIAQLEAISILSPIIRLPLSIVISSALLYGCAKAINPKSKGDYVWQTYLLTVSLIPITVISSFITSFPFCGYCFGLLFSLYHLVQLFGIVKGEHEMTTGEAVWAIVAHQAIFIAIYCSLIVGVVSIGVVITS